MTYLKADDWKPSPGIRIEGRALEVVKAVEPMSVLAGPGAGKTELLAQRATFLLMTGLCPPPQRILAISFKVDAARNLGDRVTHRCDPIQAKRFESLTLDAFAKRLVDQFLESLPDQWRPSHDYTIEFPNRDVWEEFKLKNESDYSEVRSKNSGQLDRIVHRSIPDFQFEEAVTPEQQIQWLWWRQHIDANPSRLTFDMIKALAVLILQIQPKILSALRKTYSHVFLDEFQDVTARQYELIKTAFLGSDSVLTAVGDSNQAIMRWAGAREDIFNLFEADFGASDERLPFNFRSNSRIVNLINDLATTFDGDYIPTECARQDDPVPENSVEGWVSETRQDEGEYIASFIANELQKNADLAPADFVVLARLRINDVEDRIKVAFQSKGLKIRNEARAVGGIAIQDLVKEKAYTFFLASLKLAVNVRSGQPFQDCRNAIAEVRGADLDSEKGHSETLYAVRCLIDDLEQLVRGRSPAEVTGREIVDILLNHVERGEIQRTYREYAGGERLNSAILGFAEYFDECRDGSPSWSECISNMEGTESVRLMTIHKSKGLEYHTVIFVEFNDDAFWGNDDDVNVFFVALSRARERVLFSFTKDSKGAQNVKGFVKILKDAGVIFIKKQ
ncbi:MULTISPECIES: UvrD-helicase domain-containing protein [Spongiibacteraceae]|uniref:DNA 3'-5' helicase n=1 Tax=Zhongshania aliphaticivorans TaxID=1470434 RepID=A0A127M294_9GAMM|nr:MULTISPECIES: ATP-dependent helicase [Spongiibacteraceae]AMO67330.1 hypothetical protein AZF00_03000 [Zhongshania aliphaticivorans]MBM7422305.1 superfamily I DNA/RNA helicase [Spongiibacter marinus]